MGKTYKESYSGSKLANTANVRKNKKVKHVKMDPYNRKNT